MSSGPNMKDGDRTRKPRRVTLSEELNRRLDELSAAGENISALTEKALRALLGMSEPTAEPRREGET